MYRPEYSVASSGAAMGTCTAILESPLVLPACHTDKNRDLQVSCLRIRMEVMEFRRSLSLLPLSLLPLERNDYCYDGDGS